MLNDVKSYAFDDLLSNIVDNRGKTCPVVNDGLPLIATNCVKNETLYPAFEKVRYVSNETYQNWFRGHPKPDDIIFVCKGAPGNVCWTPDPVNFCIAQDMVAIRANEDIIDSKYLFALLRSPESQSKILNMHVGTMIPHFKKGDFKNLYFDIPTDKFLQKAIGEIYFKFCERIELNRQINETLEVMAQALFKSWFVDFDPVIDNALAAGNTIPDVFAERAKQRAAAKKTENQSTSATAVNDSSDYQYLFPAEFEFTEEMGWIPLGWRNGTLMDLATKITDGSHHSPQSVEASAGSPMASSKDLTHDGIDFNSCRFISTEDFNTLVSNGCAPHAGDVLISKDGSRCAETCCIYDVEADVVLLSSVAIIRPQKKEYSTYINTLLARKETIADLRENYVSGSAIPRIVLRDFKRFPIIIPTDEIFEYWNSQITSIHQKRGANHLNNQLLGKLRETLLPKLLSGELRIPDAEKLVQEALL